MDQNTKMEDFDNVLIKIDDLSVWTNEEKCWWRRNKKPSNRILSNVSGNIRGGEFVAVLGPSGAGKTTFLVCLAGESRLPYRGTLTICGQDVKNCNDIVEILPQFDVFMPGLTVIEHLVFMVVYFGGGEPNSSKTRITGSLRTVEETRDSVASIKLLKLTELKLGSSKSGTNKETLEYLLKELKLKKVMHSRIERLSGGERRLLSLATSLLSSPRILICDEPTTGLDSYSAMLVIETLQKLCNLGKVVICSVHQPSTDLFKEFSSIMLMAEGKLLFHGSHDRCKDLFESINLRCPKNYNPAEFYIRTISNFKCTENLEKIIKARQVYQISDSDYSEPSATSLRTHQVNKYKCGWFKQVYLLLWRSTLNTKRNMKHQLFQLLVYVITSSVIIGTCYIGISGTSQRGIQDMRGLLWMMTSEVSFTLSYSVLYTFEGELPLFKREVGTYTCSSYFANKFLCSLPRCIVWPLVLVVLMTLAVQLPNHVITATQFIITLSFAGVTATAYGLGMAALFTSSGVMGDVMPCVDLPLLLMSGAFIRLSSLPPWFTPLRYISHFYYAMDAVSNIYWRQIEHIDCDKNKTSICITDGVTVLAETGYSTDFLFMDSLGLTLVMVFWFCLGYVGLKREERKGYIY